MLFVTFIEVERKRKIIENSNWFFIAFNVKASMLLNKSWKQSSNPKILQISNEWKFLVSW